jgi:hypothetical protein
MATSSSDEADGILQAAKPARVGRVVPGKLLYVDTLGEAGAEVNTFAFPLDKIIIAESNGVYHRYRGEPLSELGLKAGKKVSVVELTYPNVTGKYPNVSGLDKLDVIGFDSHERPAMGTPDVGPWVVVDPGHGFGNAAQKVTDTLAHFTTKTLGIFK